VLCLLSDHHTRTDSTGAPAFDLHTAILAMQQVVRNNAISHKGALCLAKALTGLTCLDLANNPIGRRASRQLAPLMAPAEAGSMADTDNRCW
jgi:hypothetical protein